MSPQRKSCVTLHVTVLASTLALAISARAAPTSGPKTPPVFYSFDGEATDKEPPGFMFSRTGNGSPGQWLVRAEADAPSPPNVVAQMDADPTDYRFPVAVLDKPTFLNLELSVKCRPVDGKVDQACGLVFRYHDENNYYVARANALENNVTLCVFKNGKRRQIKGALVKFAGQTWHELRVDAVAAHLRVFFDGKKVIDAKDKTFGQAGKVGLWTKADSLTYFDDLNVAPL